MAMILEERTVYIYDEKDNPIERTYYDEEGVFFRRVKSLNMTSREACLSN